MASSVAGERTSFSTKYVSVNDPVVSADWLRANIKDPNLKVGPITFETKFQPHLVWTLDQVQSNIENKTHQLIDAQSKPRFDGAVAEPRKGIRSGHVPGSKCVPFAQVLDASQSLLPAADELKKWFDQEGKKADSILTASVLAATAEMVDVNRGSEIHAYALKQGLDTDVMVCCALIDMYSKCGFLGLGIQVFEIMPERNIVSYNALMLGYGLHGLASQAFRKFQEILDNGLIPDECTFSALLCSCCHAGLVEDGKHFFRIMKDKFCIQARAEHYVYMVRLLGMNGELEEAYYLIQSLPEPVDHGIWGALLSCCDACGNSRLAEIIGQQLIENNSESRSYKVMLSNIYAGNGRWDDARELRDNKSESQMSKMPGLSWFAGY